MEMGALVTYRINSWKFYHQTAYEILDVNT